LAGSITESGKRGERNEKNGEGRNLNVEGMTKNKPENQGYFTLSVIRQQTPNIGPSSFDI
jgi:hypothetical protein